jgi:hypothetical protein
VDGRAANGSGADDVRVVVKLVFNAAVWRPIMANGE